MTSLDILESSYCMDYSMQSPNDSKLSRLPLPTQVISSPSGPPPLSHHQNNPTAKDELIQKATARLRCRLLQEGLSDVQSKVMHLQSQLDELRLELSTTENVLSKFGEPDDRQLQALERRFNTHQQQLDHVLSSSMLIPAAPPTPKSSLSAKAITASTSFSSTLSRMSSIFSSTRQQKSAKKNVSLVEIPPVPELILNSYQCSDYSSTSSCSTSEEDDNDTATPSMQEAREKRIRRRQRVKQLRREYQKRLRFYDPTWNKDDDWRSARSPSSPSVDNHSLTLESPSSPPPPPPPPQQQQQQQQTQSLQQGITLSPMNEPPTSEKKQPAKETNATTTPTKKGMTTSTASVQPKPTPAQCLCKRKSTNKPGPVSHHKAASTTSQTYHSKQPEWNKPPSPPINNHTPPHHSTAIPMTDSLLPPSQINVSGWLFDQQQLHLQQQQQQHGDDDEGRNRMDTAYDENEIYQHSVYRPSDSVPATERNGQQDQEALDLFDDVLNYLDTFSNFGSDTGLQQDISHLLSSFNRNEDDLQSTTSSSSYWAHHYPSSSSAFYQQLQLYTILINHGMATFSQYVVECVSKGISWCKFLSVLSLACLISLGRGPDHMLSSLDDMDYMDLLCDQDEFVDSYYL